MDLKRDPQDLKKSRVNIVNWSLTKEQRQCNTMRKDGLFKTNENATVDLLLAISVEISFTVNTPYGLVEYWPKTTCI